MECREIVFINKLNVINTDKKDDKHRYKYQELTGRILQCAFEVHNHLGCGFLEKVYERALIQELKAKNLKIEYQKSIKIYYKAEFIGNYIADIIVEDKVIVELKVVEFLTKIHKAQMINYLKATGYEVGLILNFAKPRLEYHRIVI